MENIAEPGATQTSPSANAENTLTASTDGRSQQSEVDLYSDPSYWSSLQIRPRIDLSGLGPQERQGPAEWQEPSHSSLSLNSFFRNGIPYFGAAWLYGPVGEIVRRIEPTTEAHSAAVYLQLLTGLGNLIGGSPNFMADGQRHGVNLFVCIVGQTSKSRKGTSWGRSLAALRLIDPEWADQRIRRGAVSGAGLLEPFREREGTPTPDRRLLLAETEFSEVIKVLGKHRSSEMLRQALDGGTLEILSKRDPITVRNAHISLIGHVTLAELGACLSTVDMANGLANRILWIYADRSKLLPEGGTFPNLNGPFFDRLCSSVEHARTRGRVERDAEAREYWGQIYPELSAAIPGRVGEILSRGEALVMRLALLFALLDDAPLISRKHLKAALAIWRYAEASARHIFTKRVSSPRAAKILEALEDGPLARSEIFRLFNNNATRAQIDAALQELGPLIRIETRETEGRDAELIHRNNSTDAP